MMGGSWERIVVQQSKISACPPNQIMDLLILVDTTSDFSAGVIYRPRNTLNIIKYLVGSYRISAWDTHVGIGAYNGKNITTEIYPNQFGNDPTDSTANEKYEAKLDEYYPTTEKSDDPNYRSLKSSTVPALQQKPLPFESVLTWQSAILGQSFRDGVNKVKLL